MNIAGANRRYHRRSRNRAREINILLRGGAMGSKDFPSRKRQSIASASPAAAVIVISAVSLDRIYFSGRQVAVIMPRYHVMKWAAGRFRARSTFARAYDA